MWRYASPLSKGGHRGYFLTCVRALITSFSLLWNCEDWMLSDFSCQRRRKKGDFCKRKKKKQRTENKFWKDRLHFHPCLSLGSGREKRRKLTWLLTFPQWHCTWAIWWQNGRDAIFCIAIQYCLVRTQHELLQKCDALVYSHCCRNGEDASHLAFQPNFSMRLRYHLLAYSHLYHASFRAHQCNQPTDSSQTLHCWRTLEA